MPKFKCTEVVEVDGVKHEIGEEIELTDEQAAGLGPKVEVIPLTA